MSEPQHRRLRDFVAQLAARLDRQPKEAALLEQGRALLLLHDDWLEVAFARPHPERYQQYLLYADAQQRFSVVSFVWGPGQQTPIHDHRVWGLIGMLRGAELSQSYRIGDGGLVAEGTPVRLEPGYIEAVSPRVGDIHRVSNAFDDRVSISIHVYGANIGAVSCAVYREDGSEKTFISGYSNRYLQNIWDKSHG
ncbi:cysteine dioxygenase family protein [Candidatus Pantoea persica]|uniref:cysteine dioxygenase family protein n=1 Tax=Candidatus Pantoea persica TaxID=2518128 RepID=UPI00215D8025|nr:cysteine dioxygenase [Candidatus Pantoea persica]MBA2817075.1 putative metal-dependent enzyme of the double-stranded beta helix superfamily protein [Candidatus Pantoea persica]